jgi:hypothetical protein
VTTESEDLWLVRSGDLVFSGPFTRQELEQQVRDKKMGYRDEVGSANGEWYRLSSPLEVQKGLGKEFQDLLDRIAIEVRRDDETDTHTSPVLEAKPKIAVPATAQVTPPSPPAALRPSPRPPVRLHPSQPTPWIKPTSTEAPERHWYSDGAFLRPLGIGLAVAVMGLLYFLLLRVRIF